MHAERLDKISRDNIPDASRSPGHTEGDEAANSLIKIDGITYNKEEEDDDDG